MCGCPLSLSLLISISLSTFLYIFISLSSKRKHYTYLPMHNVILFIVFCLLCFVSLSTFLCLFIYLSLCMSPYCFLFRVALNVFPSTLHIVFSINGKVSCLFDFSIWFSLFTLAVGSAQLFTWIMLLLQYLYTIRICCLILKTFNPSPTGEEGQSSQPIFLLAIFSNLIRKYVILPPAKFLSLYTEGFLRFLCNFIPPSFSP